MSFQYYTLFPNTSGAAVIPISNNPSPLAFLTVVTDDNNTVAVLRANIGWRALSEPTRVLFKFWRGSPVTGSLVCSVQDSAESFVDLMATTDFSQVVTGLTPGQPVTFVLTVETVDSGTLAQAIGPLTFTAYGTNLTILNYYEFFNNTFGSANIPLGQSPVPIGFVTIHAEAGQNIILRSTVGWITTGTVFPKVDVLFKLWRGAPITGVLIASADDSADAERGAVTSFSHVDSGFTTAQDVTYVLTAEAPDLNHTASIVGALTLTASKQQVVAAYVLPQNTSGSVSIPILTSGTPLAALTLQSASGSVVSLRAAVGWAVPFSSSSNKTTPVLFKIWRGAPNTGTLIYSAEDSSETGFDYRKVTALSHLDTGFTATGPVTYTLTAELLNASSAASVIGPLTFTAVPE